MGKDSRLDSEKLSTSTEKQFTTPCESELRLFLTDKKITSTKRLVSIGHDFLIANHFSDSQKKPEVGQAKRERVAKKSCWAPPAHALPTNNRAAIKYDLSDAEPDSLVAQRQRRINDEDKQQKQRSEPAQQLVRNQAEGGDGKAKGIQQRGTAEGAGPVTRGHANAAAQFLRHRMRREIEHHGLGIIEHTIAFEPDIERKDAIIAVTQGDLGVQFAPNHHGGAASGGENADVRFRLTKKVLIAPIQALSLGNGVRAGGELYRRRDQADSRIGEIAGQQSKHVDRDARLGVGKKQHLAAGFVCRQILDSTFAGSALTPQYPDARVGGGKLAYDLIGAVG